MFYILIENHDDGSYTPANIAGSVAEAREMILWHNPSGRFTVWGQELDTGDWMIVDTYPRPRSGS